MNVHHLELFYFVAHHQGITAAVRKMPYGIQQPAVSAQLLKLEQEIGAPLFHRRPFALTEAGRRVYEAIEPFFSRLPRLAEELRGEGVCHLRLAASQTVLARYLPLLLRQVRREFPGLTVTLEQASPARAEQLLLEEKVDFAITTTSGRPAPGVKAANLLSVPLALLVHADSPADSFDALVAGVRDGQVPHPLISLPPEEPMSQLFQRGLAKRRLRWTPTIVVNQLEVIQAYVAGGFGAGLSVEMPGVKPKKHTKSLPLPGFPEVNVGCFSFRAPTTLMARFLDHAQAIAAKLGELNNSLEAGEP